MYSLMKQYHLDLGERDYSVVTVTARRMENDINGTPRWKAHVWSSSNTIWSPTIKGFKRCKDDGYVLKGYGNLEEIMTEFIQTFQESVNEL